MGRVYESKKTGRDAAPITKAQIEGKEPLRTFGALKQLFTTLHDPPVVEPAAEAKPPEKAKRKPSPEASETTVTGPTAPTGNAEMPPAQIPPVQAPPAADVPREPDVGQGQGDLPTS